MKRIWLLLIGFGFLVSILIVLLSQKYAALEKKPILDSRGHPFATIYYTETKAYFVTRSVFHIPLQRTPAYSFIKEYVFTPDEKELIIVGGIDLWKVQLLYLDFRGHWKQDREKVRDISLLSFSPSGRYFLSVVPGPNGSNARLRIEDLMEGHIRIGGSATDIIGFTMSPNEQYVAFIGKQHEKNHFVCVADINFKDINKCSDRFESILASPTFSSDGNQVTYTVLAAGSPLVITEDIAFIRLQKTQ